MNTAIRLLLILFIAVWAGMVLAPALERKFGKATVLKWGTITAVALALAIAGMAVALASLN